MRYVPRLRRMGIAALVAIASAPAARAQDGAVPAFVELSTAPAVAAWTDAKAAGADPAAPTADRIRAIEAEQTEFLARQQQKTRTPPVLFRVQRVLNGIGMRLTAGEIAAIRGEPGVQSVRRLPIHYPANQDTVPYVNAPAVWERMPQGLTGEGVRVGVIDTGIDYFHANFGGSGNAAAYDNNDPTTLGEGKFPTGVVRGGVDLAGENFDPGSVLNADPVPDADPFDTNGHGSHVAGTLAGRGVRDGAQYTGAYNTALDLDAFDVAPGVAPQADLFAIKIFGAPGAGTVLVAQGLEWAVDPNGDGDFTDRMDVVNLSLGSAYNLAGGRSPDAQALQNAVAAGTVVVASAGNTEDSVFIVSEPGAAPEAISVAASIHDSLEREGARIESPPGLAGPVPMRSSSFGPGFPEEGLTGDVVAAVPADGCAVLENPAALDGRIALIDRGDCFFVEKVRLAEETGAIGVIFVNDVPGDTIRPGGAGPGIGIPSAIIPQHDGVRIRMALESGPVQITLGTGEPVVASGLADTMADFSARGPAWDGARVQLKPDIAAPGLEIVSTAAETGAEATTISGTSMAAPQVAGAAALLRQRYPEWPVYAVKARLMNASARSGVQQRPEGPVPHAASRSGAGILDAAAAAEHGVIAYNAEFPETVSLTFDERGVTGPVDARATIAVENRGSVSVRLQPRVDVAVPVPGVALTVVNPAEFTVPQDQTVLRDVRLTVDPATLARSRAPGLLAMVDGEPRHWLTEFSARVIFDDINRDTAVRVPVYAVVEPATELRAASATFSTPVNGAAEFAVDTPAETSVPYFELHGEFPNDPATPASRDWIDLAAVGVSTGPYTFEDTEGDAVFFAVAAHGEWSSPNTLDIEVALDFDSDEDPEYTLVNGSRGEEDRALPNDVFLTVLERLNAADVVAGYLNGADAATAPAPLATNMAVLPLPLALLDEAHRGQPFEYRVSLSTELDEAAPLHKTENPWFAYDPERPAFFGGDAGAVLPSVSVTPNAAPATVSFDEPAYLDRNAKGLALFALENGPENRLLVFHRAGTTENVNATDGAFADRVRVTWDAAGPGAEYQVYRGPTRRFGDAAPISDWIAATAYEDFGAPAAITERTACMAATRVVRRYYWVVTRTTESGPGVPSAADIGYRAAGESRDAGLDPNGDTLVLLSVVAALALSTTTRYKGCSLNAFFFRAFRSRTRISGS